MQYIKLTTTAIGIYKLQLDQIICRTVKLGPLCDTACMSYYHIFAAFSPKYKYSRGDILLRLQEFKLS